VQKDLARWASSWLEADLKNRSVLEWGAGTGNFTSEILARQPKECMAIDRAQPMVVIGKQRYPTANWKVLDLEKKPPLGQVDRIYSSSLLQWMDNPLETLKYLRTLLNPNGRMLHGIFVSETLPELYSCAPLLKTLVWRSALEWKNFFTQAGFQVVRLEEGRRAYTYSSVMDFLKSLHATGVTCGPQLSFSATKQLLKNYAATYRVESRRQCVQATWTFLRIETTG
jgi:ubiquinone/menaquinone biosynthesis C-methylase UbiE